MSLRKATSQELSIELWKKDRNNGEPWYTGIDYWDSTWLLGLYGDKQKYSEQGQDNEP